MWPSVVLYDFDYALADSSQGTIECVNYALRQMGLPAARDRRIRETIGLSMTATFERVTGIPATPELVCAFTEHFITRVDEVMAGHTHLYPGVRDVVHTLSEHGIKQGIVTSKLRYRIEEITAREGIDRYFSVIIGASDCPRYKPDPSGLLLALQRLGCSPEMAVYVGDHLVDAQAAAAARVAFIAVLTGLFGAHEFRKFPVQAIIPDVRELPAVLGLGEGGNGANRQGRSQQPDDGRRMVDFDPSQADSRV